VQWLLYQRPERLIAATGRAKKRSTDKATQRFGPGSATAPNGSSTRPTQPSAAPERRICASERTEALPGGPSRSTVQAGKEVGVSDTVEMVDNLSEFLLEKYKVLSVDDKKAIKRIEERLQKILKR